MKQRTLLVSIIAAGVGLGVGAAADTHTAKKRTHSVVLGER